MCLFCVVMRSRVWKVSVSGLVEDLADFLLQWTEQEVWGLGFKEKTVHSFTSYSK